MKKTALTCVILLMALVSRAQKTPEAFLGMLPAVPSSPCSMSADDKQVYLAKIDDLINKIEAERNRRNEARESNEDNYKKQVQANMSQQYGLSAEEMKQLQEMNKNKQNKSKEEKDKINKEQQAIMNKALMSRYNISSADVENLKKMDKEGQKAWGEAYGTEVMTDAQLNPQAYKEKQVQAGNLNELIEKRQNLSDSLETIETKIGDQIRQIEEDTARIRTVKKIKDLETKIGMMAGEVSKEEAQLIEEYSDQVKSLKEAYCKKYTPLVLDVIEKYKNFTRSCLPAMYRLEKIQDQLTEAQTGVRMKTEPGTIGLGKVEACAGMLKGALAYNLKLQTPFSY